jgi:hypothetical protein
MDGVLRNRLKLIGNIVPFLNLCYELLLKGILYEIIDSYEGRFLLKKMEIFDLTPNFNFILWKNLYDNKQFFNYLYLSGNQTTKDKWLQMILLAVPDLDSLLNETHHIFEYYKNILITK